MQRTALTLDRAVFALLLLPVLSLTVQADQILVPEDHALLQDAIDAASPGDVILIAGGVHQDVLIDKPLVLAGQASDLLVEHRRV